MAADKTAYFRFFGSLNDFLGTNQRQRQPLTYAFTGTPAVKDAVEAIGVPHPEVAVLEVNGSPIGLGYKLQAGDSVSVYPMQDAAAPPTTLPLRPAVPDQARFVLDVHAGKLARMLRMLGFDCRYQNTFTDREIAAVAEQEKRIVLTRDVGLLKHSKVVWGYWLRSQQPTEQLQEVIHRFQLKASIAPFTRCMACNGDIVEVPKAQVLEQLQPKTNAYFHVFYRCAQCGQVYWKGSHYKRMLEFVSRHT